MEGLQKTKHRTTTRSSRPTPGRLSRENPRLKSYVDPNVHCSAIPNSQDTETRSVPSAEERIKMWYIHTTEYYSAIKRMK